MGRIEHEKIVVKRMIELYYSHKLKLSSTCKEAEELKAYAIKRLDGCRFGDKKPACKKCPIHCYKPEMREKIRAVMRWAGPRMLIYDPIAALRHLLGV